MKKVMAEHSMISNFKKNLCTKKDISHKITNLNHVMGRIFTDLWTFQTGFDYLILMREKC